MTESFHNPYHFVPVSGEVSSPAGSEDKKSCPKIGNVADQVPLTAENLGHAAFDRFHRGTFSGRLICRLVTRSPAVFGGKQEPGKTGNSGEPGKVHSFKLNGKPAVPGSTIRGCISSVAEAASNSALRVLDDTYYSRRSEMNPREALSAVGMLIKTDAGMKLLPLAYPTMSYDFYKKRPKVPYKFRQAFPENRFKAYCFNDTVLPDIKHKTWSREKPVFYWGKLSVDYLKPVKKKNLWFMLGKRLDGPLKDTKTDGYVRGIVRRLSTPSRLEEMPTTKKHEIFIPFPEEMETNPGNLLEFNDGVLKRFQKIAEDIGRLENKRRKAKKQDPLPFCPVGVKTFESRKPAFSLADGDIVFFDIDENSGKVSKVSVSQIWREDYRDDTHGAATAHTFFKKMTPELLPFNPERKILTPAEMVFGCVEENNLLKDKNDDKKLRALAGRVRFSNAALVEHPGESARCSEKWTTLRILASPKPPSPSLYFREKNIGKRKNSKKNVQPEDWHIQKSGLSIGSHLPQGRKFYLHHEKTDQYETEPKPKNDKSLGQKNQVRPLKEGCSFLFTIDFDNLSSSELGLLAYSLCPCEGFRFKMGMGKPLGLGSVEIDIAGVLLIDRATRYSSDHMKSGKRYSDCRVKDGEALEWLRKHYDADGTLFDEATSGAGNPLAAHVKTFLEQTGNLGGIRRCLETIGTKICANVTYPLTQGQNPEEKLFQWFVQNEKAGKKSQGLPPLDSVQQKNWMPRLNKHQTPRQR